MDARRTLCRWGWPAGTGDRGGALALILTLLAFAPDPALADRAGDGSMHEDERETTFRPGDAVGLVFVCSTKEPALRAAEAGVNEVYRQIENGNCYDARPDTVTAHLLLFVSGPYWFGDDATPWSLWAAATEHGYVVYTLIPDTIGPHEVGEETGVPPET